jgi:DNA repair protein RadC
LHFLLAQSPAGQHAINQIFHLKFKLVKAQSNDPVFQVAEIQVSYYPKFKVSDRPVITSSQDAYKVFLNKWDKGQINLREQYYMLILNKANRVIGMTEIMAGTLTDPKMIFSIALKSCGSYLVFAHNHPSQNLQPSAQDLAITKRLVEAGKLLDLEVIDHLIITEDKYYSFGDEGLI